MRVVELTSHLITLPLKREIKHASHARQDSTNIVVRCRLEDGTLGYGEGVPRSYVTGETPEGAMEQIAASGLPRQLSDACESWQDAIALCERIELVKPKKDDRGCYGNALRCAIELALLDAFGQRLGEPVSRVTELYEPAACVRRPPEPVRYSGAVTAEGRWREVWSALKMRIYGFRHCKVKVGVPGADDVARLRRIRRWLGWRIDVRLDANEAWQPDELPEHIAALLPYGITSMEQPVPHKQVDALSAYRGRIGVPLMHDESLTSEIDGRRAIERGTCDLFNIRLSKCGGYLASLRLAAMADQAGLGYQLGCHPGESGILSAAGRHWSSTVKNVRYLEGSYDRHLLRELLTAEDITFGYGGRAPILDRPGLGITVLPEVLERLSIKRHTEKWS